jgi:hypothetical protein
MKKLPTTPLMRRKIMRIRATGLIQALRGPAEVEFLGHRDEIP